MILYFFFFFFSSRRRHTRYWRDWSSDVCSSDLTTTNGSNAITSSGRFWGADLSQLITATGVPAGTYIQTVSDSSHETMTANATASGSVTVTIAQGNREIGRASCRERV